MTWRRTISIALTTVALATTGAPAQQLLVTTGARPDTTVSAGAHFVVPIMADANGEQSFPFSWWSHLSWNTQLLQLDSARAADPPASGWALTVSQISGTNDMVFFKTRASPSPAEIGRLYFTALSRSGGTFVRITPFYSEGDTNSTALLRILARSGAVCVAGIAKWGDANGDATVNIIDAAQVARYTVSLPVLDMAALRDRADVNGDNTINIIDAQQLARYTVDLPASPRTNTEKAWQPLIATLYPIDRPSAVAVGGSQQLSVMPRDASGTDLAGCEGTGVTFSSSNPSIATVSSEGIITGVADGIAQVTAQATQVPSAHVTFPVVIGSAGLRVHVTSELRAERFVVALDTGAGPPVVGVTTGSQMTQGVVTLPVRPGSGYRMHVFSADSSAASGDTLYDAFVRMGATMDNVTVPANSFADVNITLANWKMVSSVPAWTYTAMQSPVIGLFSEPSGVLRECTIRFAALPIPESASFGEGSACQLASGLTDGQRRVDGAVTPRAHTDTLGVRIMMSYVIRQPDGRSARLYIRSGFSESDQRMEVYGPDRVDFVRQVGFASVMNWWSGQETSTIDALDVNADALTGSFNEARLMGREPRQPVDNDNTSATGQVGKQPWFAWVGGVRGASLALYLVRNGAPLPPVDQEMVSAVSHFAIGATFGALALTYDRAWLSSDDDLYTMGGLRPFPTVRDSALARLDTVIGIARGKGWVVRTDEIGSFGSPGGLTGDKLARMASSLAARTIALAPRSSQQAASADWSRVLSYAEQGISGSPSGPGMDVGITWLFNENYGYDVFYSRLAEGYLQRQVDARVIHAMDPSQPVVWTSTTPPPRATSPDARLASDFHYDGTTHFGNDELSPYYGSYWSHWRYHFVTDGVSPSGFVPIMLAAENDLMIAEALIRTGGDLSRAADMVNKSRAGRGHLPPVTAAGVPSASDCLPRHDDGTCGTLMEAVQYERMIELFGSNALLAWADARRFETLQPGSFRSLPVPLWSSLVPYSFGGAGNPDGRDPHP